MSYFVKKIIQHKSTFEMYEVSLIWFTLDSDILYIAVSIKLAWNSVTV